MFFVDYNATIEKNKVNLTEEQLAIVNHNHGPALVFAVAGSGKTTAMAHRIERLVRERVFKPERILASTFGTATVKDVKSTLTKWPYCKSVEASTLHSFGLNIIRLAQSIGCKVDIDFERSLEDIDDLDYHILTKSIKQARITKENYVDSLWSLDYKDFLNYVGICKGNLSYANIRSVDLPASALKSQPKQMLMDFLVGISHFMNFLSKSVKSINSLHTMTC